MPTVRAAMAPAAAAFYGDPDGRARRRRRRHRHQRQDDDRVPGSGAARGRRAPDRAARDGQERRRRRASARCERTTPEAIDLQRTFRGDARRRRRGLRDGGLLARARAAPRRRDPLRRRDLHQPDPGSPRLPRDDGGLLRGQAAAVHDAEPRVAGDQRRRPVRGAAGGRARATPVTFALRPPTPTTGPATSRPTSPARASPSTRPTGESELSSPLRGRFNVYNVLGALAAARALGVPADTAVAAIATAGQVPGPLRDRRRGPAVRGPGRLRAHAGLARERAAGGPRAGRRAAARGVRLRRRPRPRQAPADGRDRHAAGRSRDRHLRQPALRGSRGDHRRDPRRRRARTSRWRGRPPRGDRARRSPAPGPATSS